MDVEIVNDIPVFNSYDTKITAEEYSLKVRSHYKSLSVDIKIVDVLEILPSSKNTGTIKLLIAKHVSGEVVKEKYKINAQYGPLSKSEEGINFSDDFKEILTLEYSLQEKNSRKSSPSASSYKILDISLEEEKGTLVVMTPKVKKRNKSFCIEGVIFKYKLNGIEDTTKGSFFTSLTDLKPGWSLEITDVLNSRDFMLLSKKFTEKDCEKKCFCEGH
jgi:hypothetical protein